MARFSGNHAFTVIHGGELIKGPSKQNGNQHENYYHQSACVCVKKMERSVAVSSIVNSWNEWDPLEEVVVGSAENACYEPTEPGCRPVVRGGTSATTEPFPTGPKPQSAIDLANQELSGLVTLLESRGIVVRRPDSYDFASPVQTSHFAVENQYNAVCPRDVLITFGNEILEATMSRRSRFFEYLPYRNLIRNYWREDPGMIWNSAPKPSMANQMFRTDFWNWPLRQRYEQMHSFEFCITQEEVIFDAADISRFGRDIVVQESMTTNRPGIQWLRRHLEPRGFRVHSTHFPLDFFPSHIDCTFVPLRPGLILTNPERPIREGEERLFLENGWKFVDAPQPVLSDKDMPRHCQSSKWLSMNVLSLDPNTVICEAQETPLQEMLNSLGFEVLTTPFRRVFEYGGSLHCATWDVRRRGNCEDYFPSLSHNLSV